MKSLDHLSNEEILREIRKPNPEFIGFLFEANKGLNLRYLRNQMGSRGARKPEDVYKEAFLTCITKLQKDKKARLTTTFSAYLRGFLKNKVREYRRVLKQNPQISLEELPEGNLSETDPNPHELLEGEERRKLVREGLEKLGEKCRELLRLTYFDELSDKVIAGILSLAYDNVRKRRYKCMMKLKEILEGDIAMA